MRAGQISDNNPHTLFFIHCRSRIESFELLLKFCKSLFLRIPDQGPGQAQESIPFKTFWIPAYAGMTTRVDFQSSHRGFTLLELIVVLVIISLMSAVVVPKLLGPMSNLDLKTASKKISASLRYVRSHAASEKTTYEALFDFDKNRLVIINSTIPPSVKGDFHNNNREAFDRTPAEPLDHEKDRPGGLKTYNLPDGIKLAKGISREGDFNSGFFRIFFFPSGGSSGGEITVANERGRQYKINVDFITGTVQLSEVTG